MFCGFFDAMLFAFHCMLQIIAFWGCSLFGRWYTVPWLNSRKQCIRLC